MIAFLGRTRQACPPPQPKHPPDPSLKGEQLSSWQRWIQATHFPKPKSFRVFRMNLRWFFHSSPSLKMSLGFKYVILDVLEILTLVCLQASWIYKQNCQDVLKLVIRVWRVDKNPAWDNVLVEQISCVLIVVEYDCRIGTKVKPNLWGIITSDFFGLRSFLEWVPAFRISVWTIVRRWWAGREHGAHGGGSPGGEACKIKILRQTRQECSAMKVAMQVQPEKWKHIATGLVYALPISKKWGRIT